mmetsp:Transcript_41106/g.90239  ORF Transcript_41106/g.90239 Transcript_41106/m.90239 type:complete len:122 (+) Transcript_41106:429-794(+)
MPMGLSDMAGGLLVLPAAGPLWPATAGLSGGDDDTAEPAWDHLLCDRNREECCMASMPDAVELYGLFSSLSLLGLPSMRASTPTSADLGLTGLIPSPVLSSLTEFEGLVPRRRAAKVRCEN